MLHSLHTYIFQQIFFENKETEEVKKMLFVPKEEDYTIL